MINLAGSFLYVRDSKILMEPTSVNALSTGIIAFVTIIGVMFGIYYNLKTTNTSTSYIMLFEVLFVISVGLVASWIKGGMENE